NRRSGRGLRGDRPLAHPHAGGPVPDRHPVGQLSRRALHPGDACGGRGRSGDRRAWSSRLADSSGRGLRSRRPAGGDDGLNARQVGPLLVGIAALAIGTAVGWDPAVVRALVEPPPLVRAALVSGAVVAGFALLAAAVQRLGVDRDASGERDLRSMIRGVRLTFLAVAGFAAAAGWALAHPLPIVVALIVAGVDVIETSFLLLVVSVRRR